MQNGVLLIGATSLYMLWHTGGSVDALVVMYSINRLRHLLAQPGRHDPLLVDEGNAPQVPGLGGAAPSPPSDRGSCSAFGILVVNVLEKFTEGRPGSRLVVTGAVVSLCMLIKRHYLGGPCPASAASTRS